MAKMKTKFVTLRINGKDYDAISHVTNSLYGNVGYFRIRRPPFPVIADCERSQIFFEWLKEDWFKQSVTDFAVTV